MWNIDKKLAQLSAQGKDVQVGIVGAGQMGRGLVTQFLMIHGMRPSIVSSRNEENALKCYLEAGAKREDIVIAHTLAEINAGMERGKYVVTPYAELVSQANLVDVMLEATGIPDVGARVAEQAIANKKHVVMLNVETDVVVGPILKKMADEAGVIYTGSAGDEPGAVMELYAFAKAIGFEVRVVGKGKNNKLDRTATPASSEAEALLKRMNPKMLCSFKDGTKTMVELAAISNATGYIPDVVGAHGIQAQVADLPQRFRLKSEGGILNRYQVVEYVDGIAPGVFVTVFSDNPEVKHHMEYLAMGSGPVWTLYRPYHLCNMETPITIAKIMLEKESTIVPMGGLVSECVAVAKKDLQAGEYLDGLGGYTAYGSVCTKAAADLGGYLPLGLITEKAQMRKNVKQGQILTYADVRLDEATSIFRLRKRQDGIKF